MSGWAYAVVCVLAPAAWGGLMFLVFGWVNRKRRRHAPGGGEPPPTDYSI